jgi:citronellol/citronellal dehydrogenase
MSGGSRGIGLAIATRAAQDGANIVLLAKTAQPHSRLEGTVHTAAAYTMAKYGMSLVTLGLAEELRDAGIAANSLWPRTTIATAAVANLLGGDEALAGSRTPAIMADAAHAVLVRDPRTCTGQFFLDEEVLAQEGVTDLGRYRAVPGGGPLQTDLFLDPLESPA